MNKLISIEKGDVLAAYFHDRQLCAFYDHWLVYFDMRKQDTAFELSSDLSVETITLDNVDQCENDSFYMPRMRRYLIEQPEKVEGFLFFDKESHMTAGFLWVMYPGGNEFQYRVRKTDAFFFDVYVSPGLRGRGICGQMLKYVFHILKEKNIKMVALGVRANNESAIKAYKKLGGDFRKRKKFVQLFRRFNIPYYVV